MRQRVPDKAKARSMIEEAEDALSFAKQTFVLVLLKVQEEISKLS